MIKEIQLDKLYFDPDIIKLKTLTNGSDGYMAFYIQTIWNAHIEGKNDFYFKSFGHYIDDELVGWVLIQDLLYKYQDYTDMMTYVNPKYRNVGVASRLLQHVKNNVDVKISVWVNKNDANEKLYKNFNEHPFYLFDSDYYKETKKYKLL